MSSDDEYSVKSEPPPPRNKVLLCIIITTSFFVFFVCCGLGAVLYFATFNSASNRAPKPVVGDLQERCTDTTCNDLGECFDKYPIGFICKCKSGYTGSRCETEVNECDEDPCVHGTCLDLLDDFRCNCDDGFSGKRCQINENECTNYPSPCYEHGECYDQVNGFICQCYDGYTGKRCETDVNDCDPNPCIHGTCTDLVNGFLCNCDTGYEGDTCGIDTDDCDLYGNGTMPCVRGACYDIVDGYVCDCPVGYVGARCEVFYLPCDPDRSSPTCQNGGTCTPCNNPDISVCPNTFRCACPPDITGTNCETLIPVDGGWTEWAAGSPITGQTYTDAVGTCLGTTTTSTRTCTNPTPINGGAICGGSGTKDEVSGETCTCQDCQDVIIGASAPGCSCHNTNCVATNNCCSTLADPILCS